jgi:DNA-binding ferritin-like protein (Dps family)
MKEFKNFEIACEYRKTIAKKLGEGYNVSVEEIEDGVWSVGTEKREKGIVDVIKDTGKNFVKGMSGGMGLRDLKKTHDDKESFSDVFKDSGKNFVSGLSNGMGFDKTGGRK